MKPTKISLSHLGMALDKPVDLFICSSSFENRCLSIAKNITVNKVRRALILSNMDLLEYVEPNQKKLQSRFGKKGILVEVSTSDPLLTADNIGQSLKQALRDELIGSILVDVTTFTHESLLILIRLLQMYCFTSIIKGIYANASEYGVGEEVKYKWLSRGVGEVRSVLGFPGNIIPARKTHLIVIVGYEHERATGLIQSLEPNSISLAYGRSGSATTEKDKDANEHYTNLVNEMVISFSNVNRFEIPCDDPDGTCDALLNQIQMAGDVNVIIAPMNNKLSTIGAAWAAFYNDTVQLCYAKALQYNYSNYSRPGLQCYFFDLLHKKSPGKLVARER